MLWLCLFYNTICPSPFSNLLFLAGPFPMGVLLNNSPYYIGVLVPGQFVAGQFVADNSLQDNSSRTIRRGQFVAGQFVADNLSYENLRRTIRRGQFVAK